MMQKKPHLLFNTQKKMKRMRKNTKKIFYTIHIHPVKGSFWGSKTLFFMISSQFSYDPYLITHEMKEKTFFCKKLFISIKDEK